MPGRGPPSFGTDYAALGTGFVRDSPVSQLPYSPSSSSSNVLTSSKGSMLSPYEASKMHQVPQTFSANYSQQSSVYSEPSTPAAHSYPTQGWLDSDPVEQEFFPSFNELRTKFATMEQESENDELRKGQQNRSRQGSQVKQLKVEAGKPPPPPPKPSRPTVRRSEERRGCGSPTHSSFDSQSGGKCYQQNQPIQTESNWDSQSRGRWSQQAQPTRTVSDWDSLDWTSTSAVVQTTSLMSPRLIVKSGDRPPLQRRSSYAELKITHNAAPPSPVATRRSSARIIVTSRNSVPRSIAPSSPRVQTENEDPVKSYSEARNAFKQKEQNESTCDKFEMGTSFVRGTPRRAVSEQPTDRFTHIVLQRPQQAGPQWGALQGIGTRQKKPHSDEPQTICGSHVTQTHPQGIRYPSNNPYSSTATAAHMQYNSPLGLYSGSNATTALNVMVPNDSPAAQTIQLSSRQTASGAPEIPESSTRHIVQVEDRIRQQTGRDPTVSYYMHSQQYGPGKGPLRQYIDSSDATAGVSDF